MAGKGSGKKATRKMNTPATEEEMPATESLDMTNALEGRPVEEVAAIEAAKPIQPKKLEVTARFVGGARRTFQMAQRQLHGIMELAGQIIAKMVEAGETQCEVVTNGSATYIVRNAELAELVIAKTIEASVTNKATIEEVNEEFDFLLGKIKYLTEKKMGPALGLDALGRKVAELQAGIVQAVFRNKLRALVLEVAKLSDELEKLSVEGLEDSIIRLGVSKGLDKPMLQAEIAEVWAEETKSPKARLMEVKNVLKEMRQQAPIKPADKGLRAPVMADKLRQQNGDTDATKAN